jgi:hypothetical protein
MKKIFFLLSFTFSVKAWEFNEKIAEDLKNHIISCLDAADKKQSKLIPEILNYQGMSSEKNRHFLNNLCSISDHIKTRYLEIGVWKGSTFIAANYLNSNLESLAIDNWSGFGGPVNDFIYGSAKYLKNKYSYLSVDSFSKDCFDQLKNKKFDIYFYDGAHSYEAQRDALVMYESYLDDLFILIVDDWRRKEVRDGTFQGLKQLNGKILYEKELFSSFTDKEGYWEGLYIALVKK